MSGFVIAGASSNTGKTTLTLGILRALRNRGLSIQPFKTGPDYIDPMFHKVAAGLPSYNLDLFMCGESTVKALYAKHLKEGHIGVIEGVMGLYDGLGTQRDQGSTAHLSKVLKAPVILVVNAKGMSASAAALVLGFKLYDEEVNIGGVILNQLGSTMHYELLKEAVERDTGIPCLGWLPNVPEMTLKSRHLGLIPVDEVPELESELDLLADLIEKHIQVDALIALAQKVKIENASMPTFQPILELKGKRIGVFHDKAFNFYYQDNLDFLVEQGAELIDISPMADEALRPCDALYIGGGYPEIFKLALSQNIRFISSLKKALDAGLPAYAECGGMMYLTQSIDDVPLVGFFNDHTHMTKKLQRFGYVDLVVDGHALKAHEFHYSDVTKEEPLEYTFHASKPQNKDQHWTCGRKKQNTIGSYPHIHFYSNPEIVSYLFSL